MCQLDHLVRDVKHTNGSILLHCIQSLLHKDICLQLGYFGLLHPRELSQSIIDDGVATVVLLGLVVDLIA